MARVVPKFQVYRKTNAVTDKCPILPPTVMQNLAMTATVVSSPVKCQLNIRDLVLTQARGTPAHSDRRSWIRSVCSQRSCTTLPRSLMQGWSRCPHLIQPSRPSAVLPC